MLGYRNALREIEGLMMAKCNTPDGERLDMLVTSVEAWSGSIIVPSPLRGCSRCQRGGSNDRHSRCNLRLAGIDKVATGSYI
jgi:hypothetical protein